MHLFIYHACSNTYGATRATGNYFCLYIKCSVDGKVNQMFSGKDTNCKKSALLTRQRKSQCKGRRRSRSASESLGAAINKTEPTTRAKGKCTDCAWKCSYFTKSSSASDDAALAKTEKYFDPVIRFKLWELCRILFLHKMKAFLTPQKSF